MLARRGRTSAAGRCPPRVFREENAIHFLVDVEGHKIAEIERFPTVSLAWVDSAATNMW